MEFRDSYTTGKLITADKTGVEIKKIAVSEEAYLSAEMLDALIKKIENAVSRMKAK